MNVSPGEALWIIFAYVSPRLGLGDCLDTGVPREPLVTEELSPFDLCFAKRLVCATRFGKDCSLESTSLYRELRPQGMMCPEGVVSR